MATKSPVKQVRSRKLWGGPEKNYTCPQGKLIIHHIHLTSILPMIHTGYVIKTIRST